MRRWHGPVLVAVLVFASASACSAFGQSAERLSPTPVATSAAQLSPRPAPTAADGRPVIEVETPPADADVADALVVAGTAFLEEGVVHIRLVGDDGVLVAGIDAEPACGLGCRGAFRVELHFFVERARPATLEVFTRTAEEGAATGIVLVPLTLHP